MYRARYPRVCTTRLPLCLRNMLIQYVWRIHAQNDTQIMDYMIWCMNSFVCVFVCVRVRACMRMGVCVRVCMCFLYGDVHVQWPSHSLNAHYAGRNSFCWILTFPVSGEATWSWNATQNTDELSKVGGIFENIFRGPRGSFCGTFGLSFKIRNAILWLKYLYSDVIKTFLS